MRIRLYDSHTLFDKMKEKLKFLHCNTSNLDNLIILAGDYVNIMKTTYNFHFDLYQGYKQHGYSKTWKHKEAVNSFSLPTCKLIILKKLWNKQSLN